LAELPEHFEFEFTIKGRYRVHRDQLKVAYGTEDLDEAAGIDRQSMEDDPATVMFFVEQEEGLEFDVRPVK
jgi:hypothetical protein